MKRKFTKFLSVCMIVTMFSATNTMAATAKYSFSILTENVSQTSTFTKEGSTAQAGVECKSISYASATLKYQTYNTSASSNRYSAYQPLVGTGHIDIPYLTKTYASDLISLRIYNPSSNGGISVSTSGTFTP